MPKVDLPTGERFHSTAAFSWAEVASSFMDEPVYVVMKRDGKPLSEKDGRLSWSYRAKRETAMGPAVYSASG